MNGWLQLYLSFLWVKNDVSDPNASYRNVEENYWSVLIKFAFPKHALVAKNRQRHLSFQP